MADVAERTTTRVDFLLAYLAERWGDIPDVAREIDTWDLADQLAYTEEWGLYRTLLEELRRHAAEGHFIPDQRRRYEDLERLVERHDPTLRALLR